MSSITESNPPQPEQNQPEVKGSYTYDYPRPALTADAVIFGYDSHELRVLLIERGVEPCKGMWALPGGFMRMNETIEQCVRRELREETAMTDVYLEQMHVFSSTTRDPRGRVVTVAFIALVRPDSHEVRGGDDATRARWFSLEWLPTLAFDHAQIISFARQYLREVLRLRPVAFRLLDEVFTVDELREVYEAINETRYDRRNFQRKLMQSNIVEDAPKANATKAHVEFSMCCPSPCRYSMEEDNDIFEEKQTVCRDAEPAPSRSGRRARKFVLTEKLRRMIGKNTDPDPDTVNDLSTLPPPGSASCDAAADDNSEESSIKDLFNF